MTNVRVKLTFPENLVKQPIIARLVRQFELGHLVTTIHGCHATPVA